jgi:hypothetical protein
MSRAFIKEVEPEAIELPDRAVSSHPNLTLPDCVELNLKGGENRLQIRLAPGPALG